MSDAIFLFLGSYFSVFLLGLNSQLVKDGNVAGAFSIAWLITLSNMMYTKIFVLSESFFDSYILAGVGSSLGIISSIWFYKAMRKSSKRLSSPKKEVSNNV